MPWKARFKRNKGAPGWRMSQLDCRLRLRANSAEIWRGYGHMAVGRIFWECRDGSAGYGARSVTAGRLTEEEMRATGGIARGRFRRCWRWRWCCLPVGRWR